MFIIILIFLIIILLVGYSILTRSDCGYDDEHVKFIRKVLIVLLIILICILAIQVILVVLGLSIALLSAAVLAYNSDDYETNV